MKKVSLGATIYIDTTLQSVGVKARYEFRSPEPLPEGTLPTSPPPCSLSLHINFTVLVLGSSGAQWPSEESEVRWHNMWLVTKSTFNIKKGHRTVGVIDFFFSYLNVVVGHHLIIYHSPGCGILKSYHKKSRFSLFAELWPKCFKCTNYFNFTAIL